MSDSSLSVSSRRIRPMSSDVAVVDSQRAVRDVLAALDDADCRTILDAASDEALTAKEVAEVCDLPLSTTYRKLDRLADADLLEERSRLCESGKHASEYERAVADVVVSIGSQGGVQLRLFQWESPESGGDGDSSVES